MSNHTLSIRSAMEIHPCRCRKRPAISFCLCIDRAICLCPPCQSKHIRQPTITRTHHLFSISQYSLFLSMEPPAFLQREAELRLAHDSIDLYRKTEKQAYSSALAIVAKLGRGVDLMHRSALTVLNDAEKTITEAGKRNFSLPPLCETIIHRPDLLQVQVFQQLFALKTTSKVTEKMFSTSAALERYLLQSANREQRSTRGNRDFLHILESRKRFRFLPRTRWDSESEKSVSPPRTISDKKLIGFASEKVRRFSSSSQSNYHDK